MIADEQIFATLRDPSDRQGWEQLLRQENGRIASFLAFLGRRYGVSEFDLVDIKQTALVRIVLESRRIRRPQAFRAYWEQILRSSLFDFFRAQRAPVHEEKPKSEKASASSAFDAVFANEIMQYIAGKSALTREVGRGLAIGESAAETALRLNTTAETVYAVRVRIRSDLNSL